MQLLPENPNEFVVLEDNPVPECLLNVATPFYGWQQIPDCGK
jgi:hypothetical protein